MNKIIVAFMLLASIANADVIKVMLIDTGIDGKNKNFAGHLDQKDVRDRPYDYTDGGNQHSMGHGTHVAGIIVNGVCKDVMLYSCRYFLPNAKGNENMNNEIACLKRAKDMGINLVNYSGGGVTPNPSEFDAIKDLVKTGAHMVVAAGNREQTVVTNENGVPIQILYKDGIEVKRVTEEELDEYNTFLKCYVQSYYETNKQECDDTHQVMQFVDAVRIRDNYYPAGYKFDEVIPVGSAPMPNTVSDFSNSGDIQYENGEYVYSSLPGNKYGPMSGTSQATALRTNRILREICRLRGSK